MTEEPRYGARVRAIRRRHELTQAELARRLGISASYLNLIENDRRPLTAPVLLELARQFEIDLDAFAGDEGEALAPDVLSALADALFEGYELTQGEVRDFCRDYPALARALVAAMAAYRAARESAGAMAERLDQASEVGEAPRGTRLPSEEVGDLLQRHRNHFPELERAAEALWERAGLDPDNLLAGLTAHLQREHGVRVRVSQRLAAEGVVRRYVPERRELVLSEVLAPRSRNFQLAHQLALLEQSDALDRAARDPVLTSDTARAIGRVALASYFAGAVLMPYEPFLDAAKRERYDIELLGHRFRTSFEQICHRLTTLGRPGAQGVRFHMIRVDIAGNISKRFSASGIRMARFSGACPRWNVYKAFLTPGLIRVQTSEMPEGERFFCVARTIPKARGGWHAPPGVYAIGLGCAIEEAPALVYADGVRLDDPSGAVPVGVTCRVCDRTDCDQRAFPAIQRPLRVDENARGLSFYG